MEKFNLGKQGKIERYYPLNNIKLAIKETCTGLNSIITEPNYSKAYRQKTYDIIKKMLVARGYNIKTFIKLNFNDVNKSSQLTSLQNFHRIYKHRSKVYWYRAILQLNSQLSTNNRNYLKELKNSGQTKAVKEIEHRRKSQQLKKKRAKHAEAKLKKLDNHLLTNILGNDKEQAKQEIKLIKSAI